MIEFKNVSKKYHIGDIAVHALQDVSFKIESGEFVAIMGPSGSGKSTLLHVLGFLDTPDSGAYLISGKTVIGFSDDELATLRNRLAGFVFQQFHLLRRMSALNNVRLPYIYGGNNSHDSNKKAMQCLESVGLEARASHWPSELSGGEQQRTAIARALVKDPMIIFADEPTGNLDSKSEREVMEILKTLNDQGKTVIMVTHEKEVAEYAGRIITMRDGCIISDEKKGGMGKAEQVRRDMDAVLPRKRIAWKKDEYIGHLRQAVNAVLSNKVRSLLSMLGILVGVASVIAMMALGHGAKASMEKQLKSLGSNLLSIHGGSSRVRGSARGADTVTRFTSGDVEAINRLKPYVRKADGIVNGSGQVVYKNQNWSTRIEGVGYNYGEMRAAIPETGRWFTPEEIKKLEKVVILGMSVLEQLFGDSDPMGKIIKINRINFRVIGIAPEKGLSGYRDRDDIVYIPVTTAMHRVLGKDYLDQIYVEVSDVNLMKTAQAEIERILRKRHRLYQNEDTFHMHDMTEIQDMLSTTTRTMSLLLGCIAAISLVVGGIGIMNIMLVSVTERTREIGLRKAIGARRIDIMMQFLIESVVMTLIGGLLGIMAGASVALLLSHFAGWTTRVTVYSVGLATVFSIMVGIFFGLWPARRAAQLKPVEALRYE